MTQPPYPGTWSILADPARERDVYVWALSAAPDGPASAEDLRALRTPHLAALVDTGAGGGLFVVLSVVMLQGTVLFTHPDAAPGPLTVAALAAVWQDQPPRLLGVQVLDEPVTTPGPGWELLVPVALVVLAPAEE